jgi:hypothetical protein
VSWDSEFAVPGVESLEIAWCKEKLIVQAVEWKDQQIDKRLWSGVIVAVWVDVDPIPPVPSRSEA